jgi:2-methylaconitate cis-trans-isomerase PrpF
MNPLIFAVNAPVDYVATNGERIKAGTYDLYSRSLARFAFSRAYPGSGAAGTSVTAGIPGTIVSEAAPGLRKGDGVYAVRVGHPGGTLEVAAQIGIDDDGITVHQALIGRTARLLMEGKAFIR